MSEPLITRISRIADLVLVKANLRPKPDNAESFSATPDQWNWLRGKAESGSMAATFFEDRGRPIDKWHHYLAVYERHLSRFKGKPVFLLEIGVQHGGSLDMWRRYLGDEATIVGIDVDERCAARVSAPNIVRIGSQADPQFLRTVIDEFGPPDIVLDDGSHVASHQRASFDALFQEVKDDGLYIIEDLHTSYWARWEGGYRRRNTCVEFVKQLIDDIHVWYHERPIKIAQSDSVDAIHIYDSIVVIEKKKRARPVRLAGGGRNA